MKKILFTFFLTLASICASAQGFKGFVEMYGGLSTSKGVDAGKFGSETYTDIKPLVAFGLNVTEGYQINKMLFAGIGFGGYTTLNHYKVSYSYNDYSRETYGETQFPAIMLPVFADVRWTLDITRKVTPFVDLKIGYQFNVDLTDGNISWNYNSEDLYLLQLPGFYFQPTVGFRFGRASAFNLGITYNATIRERLYRGSESKFKVPVNDIKSGALMLSFGADF